MKNSILAALLLVSLGSHAAVDPVKKRMDQMAKEIEKKVITWRRDFHEHPELGNREFRTSEKIAAHLKALGLEVKTGVAKTGVVAILKGGKPGPVIALRADMDGLPVTERVDVPFVSKVTTEYNGQQTGVMHACGHDGHVAILMGVAEVLAGVKNELKGTIKFIFQPAEEGAPQGEEGGAALMIKEGVLENPKVDAIFGLHLNAQTPIGQIKYRPGGTMAAVDFFSVKVKGKQSHGAYPWLSIDPIVTASQIVNNLQTIVSRKLDLTSGAAVVTVGAIHGGIRQNIIPEEVNMMGTIRYLDAPMQKVIHDNLRQVAEKTAESQGAKADVKIDVMYPVTYNDPALTDQMVGSLEEVAGKDNVLLTPAVTGAEDFSFFQQKVPGLFFFLGGAPLNKSQAQTAPHHTPDFYIDEGGFELGIRAFCHLVVDYADQHKSAKVSSR
ncbi:N-acyl-L-amino acid amidohydrolase [Siphonobacter sp. BAB-5385]|uniref:amidohydrolase n=1 Tax=unclassified Siphonobacter TaxID=2635712 RepID=UPI000B9E8975|nr:MULTISPECIES: amidohydrolase [unclassified Siphonobacter]OZI07117.1 N-acyl-L-amino acid amidohydrolase [Siphonobacter sp. BAB-5385]PMD95728.1 N-acyl-L-amino acid amidohydrolase [Siphonobacter sp. BAB-5405]